MFPTHIFKAYDIRGLNDEISPELARALGRAYVEFLRAKKVDLGGRKIVVGRDMRTNSPALAAAVIQGITESGVDVVEIGLCTTPLFNFSVANFAQHAAGIMITASHNPGQYNGFKMTLSDGLPVGKNSGMDVVRDLTENMLTAPTENKAKAGSVANFDPLPSYLEKVLSLVPAGSIKPLKVVVDAGNGMAKATIPALLAKLPIHAEYLFLEPDGNFPNHEANPLKVETLKTLQAKVLEMGADFGFALDGDADRIGLVDEKGEVVEASFVGALAGLEVLKLHPGAKMLFDLRSSQIVPEVWQAAGGHADKCVVGHALIKKQMREVDAVYASELSLHLYYGDLYDLESPELSLLLFARLLSSTNKKLSALTSPLKKYFHSGEINFKVVDPAAVMARLEDEYKKYSTEITHLDGLWMGFDWGWFNARASNTEPVLRLNLEANTRAVMEEKLHEVRGMIKE